MKEVTERKKERKKRMEKNPHTDINFARQFGISNGKNRIFSWLFIKILAVYMNQMYKDNTK